MIWAPFVLALLLGVIVSAGLYVAYLWPAVEPADPDEAPETDADTAEANAAAATVSDEAPAT